MIRPVNYLKGVVKRTEKGSSKKLHIIHDVENVNPLSINVGDLSESKQYQFARMVQMDINQNMLSIKIVGL